MPVTRSPRALQRGRPHCIFSRGGADFAVPVGFSGQVIVGGTARPVAAVPPFLVGLLDGDRGSVPLIQIDSWFGLPGRAYETGGHVLLIEAKEFRLGLVVDRVREVRAVDESEIAPPSAEVQANPFARGLWQGPAREALIIDAERVVGEALNFRSRMPEWGPIPKEDPTNRWRRESREEFCIFTVGNRDLALPIAAAREMLSQEPATPVPQAPAELLGVLNLRGDLLPLVRIEKWLGLPTGAAGTSEQIVVVDDAGVLVGIVVDRVRDVRSIELNEIEACAGSEAGASLFRGVWRAGSQRVTIIDPRNFVQAAVDAITSGFREGQETLGRGGGDSPVGAGQTQ